jgi:hypothetical protein
MLMVLALAAILMHLQGRLRDDPDYWERSTRRRAAARVSGAGTLLLAICIVTAGRWIAYI